MATAGQSKVKEGDNLILEAEKCLKTSWLKWSPDYTGASRAFDKAALCYRNAKAYDKSRDAYERAAEAHYKNTSPFQAGRSLEQAAQVTKEMEQVELAAMLLERASTYYHESGHGDTAGQVLTKAAKLLEVPNPRKAADYHLACAELLLVEDKEREAANATRRAVNMCARARDFDKLRETLEKVRKLYEDLQLHKQLWNVAAIEIVLHLHLDDKVAAQDVLRDATRIPGFSGSDEGGVLEKLCESFADGDGDAVAEACDSVVFRSMDTDIAKLARDLKNRFGLPSPSPTSSHPPALPREKEHRPPPAQTKPSHKPTTYHEMKSELFGGSSGQRKKRVVEREEKEEEEEERGLSDILQGDDKEEESREGVGGDEEEKGRRGEVGEEEKGRRGEVGEGGVEEDPGDREQVVEKEGEEEEDDNMYGGMLT